MPTIPPNKPTQADVFKITERLVRELADRGQLIDGGWRALKITLENERGPIPEGAALYLRNAFFAGAQHLFGSMNQLMEEGSGETPTELRRMESIQQELNTWERVQRLKYNMPQE